MFVKSTKDYAGYGPQIRIIKNGLYIVYATEVCEGETSYFTLPADYEVKEGLSPDPLFFPADIFEIVEDRVSSSWEAKVLMLADKEAVYSSFPEWFQNNFYIRGHDWDFEDEDYVIMKEYIKEYQDIYSDLLSLVKHLPD